MASMADDPLTHVPFQALVRMGVEPMPQCVADRRSNGQRQWGSACKLMPLVAGTALENMSVAG